MNLLFSDFKHSMLFIADQAGTEKVLRKVFDKFESVNKGKYLTSQQIKDGTYKTAIMMGCHPEFEHSYGFYQKLPKKVLSEKETRERLLATAKAIGVSEFDLKTIFNTFDAALKTVTSETERQQIAKMGAAEIHKLFGCHGALVVDGDLVIPAEEGYEKDSFAPKVQKID